MSGYIRPLQGIKHLNGEILIQEKEKKKVRKAFLDLYGRGNTGIKQAFRFNRDSRIKQTKKNGLFYALFNWCSYATKETRMSKSACEFLASPGIYKPTLDKTKDYVISKELNSEAKLFYEEHIRNN